MTTALVQPVSPPPAPPGAEASYAHCRDVTRKRAGNFFHGLRLTPEPKRSSLYCIYAWMRAADDIVDDAGALSDRRGALDAFWQATEIVLAGGTPDADAPHASLWPAFADTVARFALVPDEFADLIAGMRDDLEADEAAGLRTEIEPRFQTRAQLERYCYRVASTVGVICIRIWGLRPHADPALARTLAVQRGLAFQLTNILRDVAGDLDEGRLYLPSADMDRFGLTPDDVRRWNHPEKSAALILSLASWARDAYTQSSTLHQLVHADGQPALWAMTTIYSEILRLIERNPAVTVSPTRASLPTVRKATIGLRALVRSRVPSP